MESRIQAIKFSTVMAAACALLLAAAFPARAVISPTINYQGYLISKVTNLPVETPQDLKFIIYPTATGITGALFSETVCNVTVTKGRYDVEVGSATGGIPADIFADNDGLWMEVQVDADGDCAGSFESMSPRVRLQASPYAFSSVYATTSSVATASFKVNTLDALPYTDNGAITISTNLFVLGGISVGSISPGQTLAVAGVVESSTGGFKFPDGSIQTRAAAFTMWDLVGPTLYTINPGDVAIGESNQNPLARLHVSSATNSGGVDNLFMVSTVTGSSFSQLFLVNSNGEVHANHYYGDGTTLTGIVRSAGDAMSGPLTLGGSTLTVTSPDGILTPNVKFSDNVSLSSASAAEYGGVRFSSNVYAAGTFYGDGAGLTGVISLDGTKVLKAGDTMTGQLTLSGSTLTVGGNAFSVGGSSLSVLNGNTSLGGAAYQTRLTVNGGITATSSITATGPLYGSAVNASSGGGTFYSVTAASGTFWGFGTYSVQTTSGIKVNGGGVEAPYFVGDGTFLSGVIKSSDTSMVRRSGDSMTGNLEISGSSLTVASYGNHKYALTVASAAGVNAYGLSVTTLGYVGAGVDEPSAPLEVNEKLLISNSGATDSASLDIESSGLYSFLRWRDTTNPGYNMGVLGYPPGLYAPLIYRARGTDPYNGGAEVFRITTDASDNWKFGIGTDTFLKSTPREKFHVMTNVLVSSGTQYALPVLHVDTGTMNVMITTDTAAHTLTVGGDILSASSVTAQGGFFGDGSGLTNLQTSSLPGVLDVSTITAREDSAYDGVAISTTLYAVEGLAVGTDSDGRPFTPSDKLHVRGNLIMDHKTDQSIMIMFYPNPAYGVGADSYIRWEDATVSYQNKGVLGIKANSRDLVYRGRATTLSDGTEIFRAKPDGGFIIGGTGANLAASASLQVGDASVLFASTASASVGISTGAPQDGFHVIPSMLVGESRASAALYVSTQTGYTGIATGFPEEGFHSAASLLVGVDRIGAKFYVSTGTGYTGVGTGSPQAKLHVEGYSLFTASAVIQGGGVTGTAPVLNVNSDLLVRADGRVGIGAASPQALLDVSGGGIFSSSVTISGSGLTGTQSALEVIGSTLVVRNDGTVGIGAASPQARLDVAGSAQFGSGVGKSTFTAGGYFQPVSMTTAELQAASPPAIGAVAFNSTITDICVSTGTGAGQWALAGSKGADNCY